MAEDAGRGFRRVVPSPEPLGILEADAIRGSSMPAWSSSRAAAAGCRWTMTGAGYVGVDAVIDKDLAAQRLASALGVDALVLVTGVTGRLGSATARRGQHRPP